MTPSKRIRLKNALDRAIKPGDVAEIVKYLVRVAKGLGGESPQVCVSAAQTILDRYLGKPTAHVEVSAGVSDPEIESQRLLADIERLTSQASTPGALPAPETSDAE